MNKKAEALETLAELRAAVPIDMTDPKMRQLYSRAIETLTAAAEEHDAFLRELLEAECARATTDDLMLCGPICEAVARRRDVQAAPLLARLLLDTRLGPLKEDVAEILGVLGDSVAEAALRSALTDDEPGVRAKAAASLARLRVSAAVPEIAALLRDDSDAVREHALEALLDLGARAAAPELIALLIDPDEDPYFRAEAARVLGELEIRDAVSHLREVARREPDSELGEAAREALDLIM